MVDETRHLDPDEAFSLVGEEKRFAIVEALWEADDRELSFSELREVVGIRDSGQFNYHLDKLTDAFVRKTDAGTYTLRHAGERAMGSILSGGYTRTEHVDPIPVDSACPDCGADLVAAYEEETATIECTDCDVKVTSFSVPPGILDGYDREQFPSVFDRWVKSTVFEGLRGFCPLCMGRLVPTVSTTDPESEGGHPISAVGAVFECARCGASSQSVLSGALIDRPELVAFAHDHGVDVWRTPLWELDWLTTAETDVLDEDPFRAGVTYELDGDRLSITVDEDLTVVDTERTDQ